MHAVRQQILEILKEGDGATVAELADQLSMAAVSVRHHLDILQGDDMICVVRVERKGNVGRPQKIYGLTNQADEHFPDNFASLAESLVRQIKMVLPAEQVQCAFHTIASEMAQGINRTKLEAASMEERLDMITEFLTQHGYHARWEAVENAEDGYLLHKYNCPYAGVSAEHQELCLMDQALVDELLGQPSHRAQSMILSGSRCTYHIGSCACRDVELKNVETNTELVLV